MGSKRRTPRPAARGSKPLTVGDGRNNPHTVPPAPFTSSLSPSSQHAPSPLRPADTGSGRGAWSLLTLAEGMSPYESSVTPPNHSECTNFAG